MSTAEKLQSILNSKNEIKAAILGKGKDLTNIPLSGYANAIREISSLDTSDATATSATVLNGYTAYANGEKIEGSFRINTLEVLNSQEILTTILENGNSVENTIKNILEE